jgi:uncharacterized protein DUF1579
MQRVGRSIGILCLMAIWAAAPARSAEQAQGHAGRLDDSFLENLVGNWQVSRRIRGTVVRNTLKAEWVLQHTFVQLDMRDAADPPQYEARVLIGYDAVAQRYVAHWCDSFGAQYSSVGYGKRDGNVIDFVFSYPDGPFHNRFSWDPARNAWTFLMEAEGKDGKRTFFAEDTVKKE